MARLGNNGTGKTDWYGSFGSLLSQAFSGQVFTGLDVVAPGSTMSVTVNAGTAAIPTGSGASTSAYLVRNDTSGGESVTISTANGSNPRNDLIVAYYDIAVIDATNPNNATALKFAAVAGTPSASPADPSGAAIQTAVGATNPYIILARVRVDTSVTQIAATGKVTDLRTMASPQIAAGAVTDEKRTSTVSFLARRTTLQTLTSGAATKVQFATEDFDTGADYDNATNHRFTAPYDGIYHFNLQVKIDAVGEQCWAQIKKNGSEVIAWDLSWTGTASQDLAAGCSIDVKLIAGDYVEGYALHNAGSDRSLIGTEVGANYFSGHLVGRAA